MAIISFFFKKFYQQYDTILFPLAAIVAVGIPTYIGFQKTDLKLKELFHWKKADWHFLFPLLIVVLFLALSLGGIFLLIEYLLPIPDFFQEANEKIVGNLWLGIFGVVIVALITEEVFFRGLILNGFLKNYSVKKAVIVSALLFAAVHLNPWGFVVFFFMGVFLAWIYLKTKNLIHSIFSHAVFNLLPVLAHHFSNTEIKQTPLESFIFPLLLSIFSMLFLFIGIYWLNRISKRVAVQ